MTKISIVSPVYNGQKYISNFIKAIEKQTFKDFELLLVNDGSTDDTYQIAREALKNAKFPYQIINKENGGQSSARNLGIKKAKGDFIVFLDSDDTIQSKYLENLYKVTISNNCEIAICDLNRVSEDRIFEELNDEFNYEIKNGKEFFVDFIKHDIEIGPYSLLINSKLLKKTKLLFNENSRYSEEFIFITHLLHEASFVVHLKQRLYNYCLRDGSVSTGATIEKILNGYYEIIKANKKYIECNCEYCQIFNEFAMPRWVLATSRFTSENLNYRLWKELMIKLDYKNNLKKLSKYKNLKIKCASLIVRIWPYGAYKLFRFWSEY